MTNRQHFLFERDADLFITNHLHPFAKAASVKKDAGGYWVNVHWNCGITAPLTYNEALQAEEETK